MEKKKINQVEFLVKSAIVASIYAALTIAMLPFSYYGVQFRIAEILVLLVFIDRRYIYGLTLGCLIANLPSPLGPVDVIFGTLATLIALLLISRTKNLLVATLWPALVNGVIIGLVLHYLLDLPFLLSAAQVFLGEFIVVTLIGYIIVTELMKNKKFIEIIRFK